MLNKIKKILTTPFIYSLAILLLFEQWLWRASKRLLARLPLIAFIVRLEIWIASLSPYAALAIFVAPSLLIIPIKIVAVLSIAHGHPTAGVLIVVLAKLLGTALVAWLYSLTNNALSTLVWFVLWRERLLRLKDHVIGQLRASAAWQQIEAGIAALHAARKRSWEWLQQYRNGKLQNTRWLRAVRKLAARWRERS